MDTKITGTVVRATGSWYEVLHEGSMLRCRIRGKLRLKGVRSTNPVVVGDRVECEADEKGDYAICAILPRRNYVIRRASNLSKESHIIAANIDRALLLVTLRQPATPPEFVDRFLVTCEAYKIPVTILLSKTDLQDPEAVAAFGAIYRGAGYEVATLSVHDGTGLDRVRKLLAEGTTLLSGNSGVGKSTLIRTIDPSLDIRTGEISESHGKGRHTTTFSTMYPLAGGGAVIDTPGIKGFGLIDIDDAELAHYFPEMMRASADCRFYNCTHTHEPGCAVVEAIRRGEIAPERYESYLKMLDEDENTANRDALLAERIACLREFMTEERFDLFVRTLSMRTRYATLLAENTYHGQNAAALIRHCEAFGVQRMHTVETLCPFEPNTAIARGTERWIDVERHASTDEALAALRGAGYRIVATTPHREDSTPETFDVAAGPFALVFGTEHSGISDEVIAGADAFLRIPMCGMVESLNVSASAAIIVYQLTQRIRRDVDPHAWQLPESERLDILYRWMLLSVKDSQRILEMKLGISPAEL